MTFGTMENVFIALKVTNLLTLFLLPFYRQGYQMFGVKISFVATRSGLLRWIDHIPHAEDSPDL